MPPTMLADVPPNPVLFYSVVFGGFMVAGVATAMGLAWLGYWLIRWSHRKSEPVSKDVP